MSKNKSIAVVFEGELPKDSVKKYDEVITPTELQNFLEPGSIYEASAFAEELSDIKLADGTPLPKSFMYKGYELWWMYYNSLYLYFCLPYTQYRKLLEHLKNFQTVYLFRPPYKTLLYHYLSVFGVKVVLLEDRNRKRTPFIPFGILLQILLTLISIPILMITRPAVMIFTGDKFESGQDYDFRFKFIYKELRKRNIKFFEVIRSLESWKAVLSHALVVRKRPVIYAEAVSWIGRLFSFRSFRPIPKEGGPEEKFKFLIATHYLKDIYHDVRAIQMMKWIFRSIGPKGAYITAALDRNFHAFLGAKLNKIPTVGILHGVASRYYNGYDFLPGFKGEKFLSVDKYGVWSNWWKEYYLQHSKAYLPEQLYVSGPMRPQEGEEGNVSMDSQKKTGSISVLLVSEQLAIPQEVIPYLEILLNDKEIKLYITFRHYRDDFENWLKQNRPEILDRIGKENIIRTGIKDALKKCEVVVGTMSTAVIEALFQHKVPILFYTKKWGDYFTLKEHQDAQFFAETPKELVEKIKKARSVSNSDINDLLKRYFGDPYKNGSAWVIDQLEVAIEKGRFTK